jgi:hypothetical protein
MAIFALMYNAFEMQFLADHVARIIGGISILLILVQLMWTFVRFVQAITKKNSVAIVANLITGIALAMIGIGMFWVTLIYFGIGTYTDG